MLPRMQQSNRLLTESRERRSRDRDRQNGKEGMRDKGTF